MRVLNIAVIACTLVVPSVVHSQDSGRVGGPIGPNLEFTAPAHPAGSQQELQRPPTGTPSTVQPFAGYPATPGGHVPTNVGPTTPANGGMASTIVNGHNVIFDPTTGVIVRVLN